jgi:PAS domain S-box-containing protein/putative nucleotidyltransferase with HDIG domain
VAETYADTAGGFRGLQSASEFVQVLDGSRSLVYVKDLENRFLFANRALCTLLGLPREIVIGKRTHDVLPPEVADQHRANDELVLRTGAPLEVEESAETDDGLHYYLTVKNPVFDEHGHAIGVAGISSDITERKRAEAEAIASRAKLVAALEAMTDAVSISGVAGQGLDLNDAFVRFYRFGSRAECPTTVEESAEVIEFFDLDGTPTQLKHWPVYRALAGEIGTNVEYGVRRKDTGQTWVATYGFSPILDGQGNITGAVVVGRDVTEQRRGAQQMAQMERLLKAQEALVDSEERYRQVLEASTDFVWEIDATGRFTFVSEQIVGALGFAPDELIGKTPVECLMPEQAAAWGERQITGLLSSPRPFRDLESGARRKDGTEGTVLLNAVPIYDPEGAFTGYRGIGRDVTERRRAEQRIADELGLNIAILEASPIGTLVCAPGGAVVIANEAVAKLLGEDVSELLGSNMRERSMMRAPHIYAAAQAAIRSGMPQEVEWATTLPNGLEFCAEVRMSSFLRHGEPHLLVLFTDVSERLRAKHAITRANERLESAFKSIVATLGKVVETRDPYTQGHERGVALIARQIAEEMGLPQVDVDGIEVAGLVHDVGKLCVPTEILTKPGKLTVTEFALIKGHSQAGYDILKDVDFDWPVAEAVLQHHERVDGSGYPNALTGEQIEMGARVLMVADTIEAMASHRPYRAALGLDAAMAEILAHTERYDPDVVSACVRLYERGAIDLQVSNGLG